MPNIPQKYVCGVIPPHILTRVAEHTSNEASGTARATLEHMRELATGRAATLLTRPTEVAATAVSPRKRRNVYTANHTLRLPGKLVLSEHKTRGTDVEVNEAYDGSGSTYDFFANVFRRSSIDGRGMRLDSTVHYRVLRERALERPSDGLRPRRWTYLLRFTASVDVIAHELTHGLTQFAAALGYHGQTGALNEHLSDAFGIMVKQWLLGLTADKSDWLIGAGIFGPAVHGVAVRSMAAPGTAYDDPVLGKDPQPSHMHDYLVTTEDNGGVHINSGILNHAFYRAAIALGGNTWDVLGRVWYVALTDRLRPEADFADFVQATVDIAGELYGNGGKVQRIIAEAWSDVGLFVLHVGCDSKHIPIKKPRQRPTAVIAARTLPSRRRPAR